MCVGEKTVNCQQAKRRAESNIVLVEQIEYESLRHSDTTRSDFSQFKTSPIH